MKISKNNDQEATLSHCESYHLSSNCEHIKISSNFTFDGESKDISIHSTKQNKTFVYKPHEYLPSKENTFYICGTNPEKEAVSQVYDWEEPVTNAEYYIGIILTTISILFEISFIITFAFFKDIQNRGGFNVLVMMVLLLVSDVTFILIVIIVGVPFNACKSLAVVLHWSLLCTQFWGLVLVSDLSIHLMRAQTQSSAFTLKKLFMKFLVCLLPAASIIFICVALEESNTLKIGYGLNEVCWITSFYPRLGFYLIPSNLAFIASLVLLFVTFRHLYQQEKNQRKTLKDSGRLNRNLAQIALKLIVVLGSAEVIGFIQIPKSDLSEGEKILNLVFALLYTIVRSCRGIFVFYLYLGNEKALKFYKRKLTYIHQSEGSATGSRITLGSRVSDSANSIPVVKQEETKFSPSV